MKIVFVTTTIGARGHYGNHFAGFGEWPNGQTSHSVDIDGNKIVFVNQEAEKNGVIKTCLSGISGGKEIYIAAHESGGGVQGENGWHVAKFGHGPGGEVFDAIVALENLLGSKDAGEAFDSLCRIIDLNPKMAEFAQFRHDIGKYFLPLDIDLQALEIIPVEKRAAYWAQIDKVPYNNDNFPTFENQIMRFMQDKTGTSIEDLKKLCGIENGGIGERAEIRVFLRSPVLKFSDEYPTFHDWFKALMNAIDKLNPKRPIG